LPLSNTSLAGVGMMYCRTNGRSVLTNHDFGHVALIAFEESNR
jgi:hypothetical protein